MRILLLEDDAAFAGLVRDTLAQAAWGEVVLEWVETLAAATSRLQAGGIDLVITDLNLPDAKGLETVETLGRSSECLVIVLTGEPRAGLREAAIGRGAYDLLSKDRLDRVELQRLVRLASLQAKTFSSLRRSEARLKAIVDAEPECVKLVDAEGHLVDMNAAGLRMIEADGLDSVRGRSLFGLIVPRHRDAFRALTARVAAGEEGSLEFEIVGLKGTRRWLETHAVPLREEGSGLRLVLGITRDVSERRRAQDELLASRESLRRAELEYRSIFENAVEGIYRVDASGRVITANPALARMLGYEDPAELEARVTDIARQIYVHPEDRRRFRDLLASQEVVVGFETRWRQRDGSAIDVSLTARRMRGPGSGEVFHLGTAVNITARIRAEEDLRRFRLAMDNSADMILLIDRATMRYVDVNGTACRLLGYSREELLAMGPQDLLPAPREELEAAYDALIANPSGAGRMNSRYRCKDGSELPFESTRHVLRSGERWIIAAISRDIRERLATERALRESEARFRSLTELSSDFYWETGARHQVTRIIHGPQHRPLLGQDQIGRARWESPSTQPDAAGWAEHRSELEAHRPFRDFEFARLDARGEERHLSISGEPVFDAQGAFLGYRGIGKDITTRKRSESVLALEHRVTRCLAEADSAAAGVRAVLRAVCEAQAWQCGRYFRADEQTGVFRFAESWHVASAEIDRFIQYSAEQSFAPGRGIVGIAGSGEPVWVADLAEDPRVVSKRLATEHGMRGAFMFPVASEGRTIGVLSFTSREVREPDDRLLQAARIIGSQLGQFLTRRAAEDAQRRFRAALDASADMVLLVSVGADGKLLDFNETACYYLGYPREELLGQPSMLILADVTAESLHASHAALLARPDRNDLLVRRFRRKNGMTFEVEVLRRVIDSPDGPILVINARDLTERRRLEERQAAHLRYQEATARFGQSALGRRESADLVEDAVQSVQDALRAAAVAYVECGPQEGQLVLRGSAGLAGAPREEIAAGDDPAAVLPFGWARSFEASAGVPVHGDEGVRGALWAFSEDGTAFGPEESKFLVAAAAVLSTGLRRIESEGRLAFLAQFDVLTGLPNRALLSDRFSQLIVQAKRREGLLGVLFIDLDDFKSINDSLGHAGGDELLIEVARRLQAALRPGDTVARISGDEFAVILNDLARPDDAALVAQKIIDGLAAPLQLAGQEAFVSASVGIAAFPADGDDAEALLAAADAAMYRAKQSGGNGYQFFTADINQRTRARAQLGVELRRALEREEFALCYQPKYDLRSGLPCGAEALLRWNHPERGMVMPGEFIPVLEQTGLIVQVGEWVLRRACQDIRAWRADGLPRVAVAVNLSARQFRQQDLHARIIGIVREAQVDPALIEVEITESQLMHDPDQAIGVLRSLSEAGIRTAIDDFGTGYSSLAYLSRFPVSALKVDRSFIADLLDDEADAAIVRTIVDMAKTLGFTVVAEGVEEEAQASFLRGLGCHQAQGYLYARPMAAADFAAVMRASRAAPRKRVP